MRVTCAVIAALLAAAPGPLPADDKGTFTVQLENDRIADTDRHYTHGTRLSWVSPGLEGRLPWARQLLDRLYPFKPEKCPNPDADECFDPRPKVQIGVALGQNIYTPEDIAERELLTDDRPYAGWLYGGLLLHTERDQRIRKRAVRVLDTLELNVGVVGPSSYAEETQQLVHRIIDVQRPNGWDNQLKNEPGVMLTLERKWRPAAAKTAGLEWDLIPHAGISLGNVSTALSTGARVRMGQGLHVDFGPPHIRPNLSGSGSFQTPDSYAWYLFAGAGGRFVARDIFLDGNTFTSSHSVDKRPFVGDFQLGAAFAIEQARVTFSHVFRTREFHGQREPDRFGAISVSLRF